MGICHRDIKPGNVFVLGDPRGYDSSAKLLDFGVATFFSDARRTISGRRWRAAPYGFTPSYAAPEQFSEAYGITGPWTDVFALALLLIETVTGREPLGDGPTEQLARVATDPERRPTPRALGLALPDAVERVFERALEIYPAQRWQTAGSFWRALRDALSATRLGPPEPSRSSSRAAPLAGLGLAILLAIAASTLSDMR
jgi:serine/threonine protein kinase